MPSYRQYGTRQGRRWYAYWRTPDHKAHVKRGFARKIDAQRWAAENITHAQDVGSYTDPALGRTPVRTVYQKLIEARRPIWKPGTYVGVDSIWRNHLQQIADAPINALTHADLQQIIAGLAATPGAASRTRSLLCDIWQQAADMGVLHDADAARRLQTPPRRQKPRRYLTLPQLMGLARNAGPHGDEILVMGLAGLRWGELSALHADDIDTAHDVIHVRRNAYRHRRWYIGPPKNGHARDVQIPRFLSRRLAQRTAGLPPDAIVFPDRAGDYQQNPSTAPWWRHALEKTGLPRMGVHALRHTAASLAVASGADVKVVQNMLGHSSAAMTLDVYADLFQGHARDVADRLDAMIDGGA